jgi:hypothetical protein
MAAPERWKLGALKCPGTLGVSPPDERVAYRGQLGVDAELGVNAKAVSGVPWNWAKRPGAMEVGAKSAPGATSITLLRRTEAGSTTSALLVSSWQPERPGIPLGWRMPSILIFV